MAEITNTTIAHNAALAGGGFAQATPYSSLMMTGSIVAGNTAKLAPDFGTLFGTVKSGGYNLIGMDFYDQFPAQATDKEGMDPMLMALADNGGMTMTHMPKCSSPVINMGNPDDNSPDQIGQPVFGGTRDIGSFERQSPCKVEDSSRNLAASDKLSTGVSIYPNPVVDNFLNVSLPEHYAGNVTLRIVSSDGRVRHAGTVQSVSQRLDVSAFAPGAYTLQVINGEERESIRFVIAR